MNRRTQPKRALAVLMVAVAMACAGCGSSSQAAEIEPLEASASDSTTTAPEATTSTSAVEATTDEESADAEPADGGTDELPDFGSLTPGVTYVTATEVPISFSIAESDTAWWAVFADDWSASMVYANLDDTGDLDGPQLSLGVAEPGATSASVVSAMTSSAEGVSFQETEGLFGGRDAVILDGIYEDSVIPGPLSILTGEISSIKVIGRTGRAYRSHIFEEDDRMFIITVEADPDGIPVVMAEAARVFESFQVGDAG